VRKVRTTEDHKAPRLARASRVRARAILGFLICTVLLVTSGCAGGNKVAGLGSSAGSSEATKTGAHMAGPAAEVHISEAAVKALPPTWVLTSPQSAVRSYLDWTTYAYRVGQAVVASQTMSPDEGVRVDSYIQYNIEQKRLLDEKLTALTFGKPSVGATRTVVPAKEVWTYSYLSIDKGNNTVGGPYTISYDTSYTVIKSKAGTWVVDSVKATPHGTVK
jgi:hypothetical protein